MILDIIVIIILIVFAISIFVLFSLWRKAESQINDISNTVNSFFNKREEDNEDEP